MIDDSTVRVNGLANCDERPIGLPPGLDESRYCNLHDQLARFLAHYPTEDEAIVAFRNWCEDRIQSRDRAEMAEDDDATPEQDSGEDDGPDREYIERSGEYYRGLGDLNAA